MNGTVAHPGEALDNAPRMQRRIVMRLALQVGVGVALFAGLLAGAGSWAAPGAPALHACGSRGARCGNLSRPLDSTGRIAGRVGIYFELYPATGPGPRRGTLVATEGGPGFAATASREAYLELFAPLRADHDVVLMDNRGTGGSGFLDCGVLADRRPVTPERIGRCGAALGPRAALFGTADAADDLAALLEALGAGPVDLYGDSYGTFFAQVFALRHPDALRSLVLDGAYPLDGPDIAWLPDYGPAMRAKFDRACERDPRCAALAGRASERLAAPLATLRARPRQNLTPGDWATVLYASAPSLTTLREADAAARAFAGGDERPLIRLVEEARLATRSDEPPGDTSFSSALATAVSCNDTPSVLDLRSPPAQRRAAFTDALAAREREHPNAYAPFTYAEYLGMPPDYRYLDQCIAWPVLDPGHPPAYRLAATRSFAPIPVLVVSGDLDNITSAAEGAAAAAAWPHGAHVVIGNGLHVNALPHARSDCAAQIVRHFIATLGADATPCAAPAVRLVPAFARRAAELEPVVPLPGDASVARDRALAAAAAATVADMMSRPDAPRALRAGTARLERHGTRTRIVLQDVRWCEDVAVTGRILPERTGGGGAARLSLVAADGTHGTLSMRWPGGGPEASATLEGAIGGRALRASARAP
jgi:pimeloyl-ACP methyl ester carboxylesterase